MNLVNSDGEGDGMDLSSEILGLGNSSCKSGQIGYHNIRRIGVARF